MNNLAVVPEMEPKPAVGSELLPVLDELRPREPIFHRPELGVSVEDLERQVAPDLWEMGASGRRYSRDYVPDTLR